MSLTTKRLARIAFVAGLALVSSASLSANSIAVTGYTTDGSDAGGPQILLYANTTQYPAIETKFTEVYVFIDGRPIHQGEHDPWLSLKMIYDTGYDQYWSASVPTTPGWHSVQFLAHTGDDRWVWDPDADWIYIDG